ncbi:hypothetical protein CIHG_09808 [Coccidioides immitis H538.4]|uniref:Uncharacterized protein n=2 Tax=Coccidioides immitis TaxID=5501 RepID=A0A0J8S476_COCIT|nr:hypothetical protein CIRG_09046 [Coccidioides immitis RMSCC 2394]KMU91962.1 hypothetical protein CIHG_09808 [Coccidioides immitis H538.4]
MFVPGPRPTGEPPKKSSGCALGYGAATVWERNARLAPGGGQANGALFSYKRITDHGGWRNTFASVPSIFPLGLSTIVVFAGGRSGADQPLGSSGPQNFCPR